MTRIVLRGARVVSMSPRRPDSEPVDILVEGAQIGAVGRHVAADGATVVDLDGRIIVPGLINAHLHTWQTAMRLIGVDWSLSEYLATAHGELAPHFRPADIGIGTLAGALNQIDAGVTTIADWSHNCITDEHADAALEALTRAGIRAVFLHGAPHGLRDRPHDVTAIDRLLAGPFATTGLVSLGMAIKGPQLSKPEVAVADLRAAAERGLLVSMHQSAGSPGPGWRAVSKAGLWGPSTNIVHGTGLSATAIKTLTDAGATFTATPENELGQGHTTRLTELLLAAGSAPSVGTDSEMVTSAEMPTAARVLLAMQRGVAHERALAETGLGAPRVAPTAKQALSWITVEGARALGLSKIGRIERGFQADLTVIDARMFNLWPSHDAVGVALHAHPGNIEAVMVAGRWRKRDHALVDVDFDVLKGDMRRSGERLAGRIRRPGPMGKMRRRVVRGVVRRQLAAQARTVRRG